MPVYYRNRVTGKIEGKYVGCDTLSPIFRNEIVFERFESDEDLELDVKPKPTVEASSLRLFSATKEWEITISETGRIQTREVI